MPQPVKNDGAKNGKKVDEKREKVPEAGKVVNVKDDKHYLLVENVSAKWDPSNENDFLKNISFDVHQNELTVIIGPVGSGKVSDGSFWVSWGTVGLKMLTPVPAVLQPA